MKTFIKNKNKVALFLVIFGFFFLSSQFAYAGPGDYIATAIATIVFSIALSVMGFFFNAASLLFAWVVNPASVTAIIGSPAVVDVWTTVRDFTNMFFILVLLFSAFSTVFQIEKYNIRRILLTLVIMALLVNFSYPIARAIIDISNIIMYDLLNNMFSGTPETLGATIGHNSGITQMLFPKDVEGAIKDKGYMYMTFLLIFLFLLSVTILVIGALLLVRLITLAIVVMFSPIGFVGAIFPGFNKYSSQWWESLLKHSFSGPIMIFFIAVTLNLMIAIGNDATFTGVVDGLASNSSTTNIDVNFLARTSMMMVPIFLLWAGMAMAQKTGLAGAAMISGTGQKFSRWAGNLPRRGASKAWHTYGGAGAAKAAREEFRKSGKLFGAKVPLMGGTDRQEAREARLKQVFGIDNNAVNKLNEKRNREDIKKNSERLELTTVEDLIATIDRLSHRIADGSATKEEHIEFAGAQRQAQSRGREYEDARKRSYRTSDARFNRVRPTFSQADEAELQRTISNPPVPADPNNVTDAEVRSIKAWETSVGSLEKQRKELQEWEKAEREHYNEVYAQHMTEERRMVAEASRQIESRNSARSSSSTPPAAPPVTPPATPPPTPNPTPTPTSTPNQQPRGTSPIVDQYGRPY